MDKISIICIHNMDMDIKKLIKEHESVCERYVRLFAAKQGLYFDGWVNDEVGGIACFGDYYIDFMVIVYDINTFQKDGTVLRWYSDCEADPQNAISYKAYTKMISSN